MEIRDALPVRLDHAVLCLDCERVFELRAVETCPVCASQSFVPIARWLNRDVRLVMAGD